MANLSAHEGTCQIVKVFFPLPLHVDENNVRLKKHGVNHMKWKNIGDQLITFHLVKERKASW